MAATEAPQTPPDVGGRSGVDPRELMAVVLLSVTAVFTAWAGFQSSSWSGATSIAFNQSSSARAESAHQEATADKRQALQVSLFVQWFQAHSLGNARMEDFIERRFPAPLDAAFDAWIATRPDTNADAPPTPFAMPQYVLPEVAAAEQASQRADRLFADGLNASSRADNYTLLTVLYASVLFFAGMSAKVRSRWAQWSLVWVGSAIFLLATGFILTLPKLW
ncbi:hypothetical protein [Intrasporangium sp.]|uniref:hypothetical protein n=1 Tax=Intrasporangium sp. TaxID=1925024 RepID=UPI003221B776